MISYVPVPGTWGIQRPGGWFRPGSPLDGFLQARGFENICARARVPFIWTTNLDFTRTSHYDWQAGGDALYYYLAPPLHPELASDARETVVISHSHGLQVVLYAAAAGLKIDRFIDIAGPVRQDMDAIAAQARPNIRRWLHVHSDFSDRMQWLGELCDGHFGIVRRAKRADVNVGIKKVGHSGLVDDPRDFHFWSKDGLIEFLAEAPAGV